MTDQTTDRDGLLEDADTPDEAQARWERATGITHPRWAFRGARYHAGSEHRPYRYTVYFVCGCMSEQADPHGEWTPLPSELCPWHAAWLPEEDDIDY